MQARALVNLRQHQQLRALTSNLCLQDWLHCPGWAPQSAWTAAAAVVPDRALTQIFCTCVLRLLGSWAADCLRSC